MNFASIRCHRINRRQLDEYDDRPVWGVSTGSTEVESGEEIDTESRYGGPNPIQNSIGGQVESKRRIGRQFRFGFDNFGFPPGFGRQGFGQQPQQQQQGFGQQQVFNNGQQQMFAQQPAFLNPQQQQQQGFNNGQQNFNQQQPQTVQQGATGSRRRPRPPSPAAAGNISGKL